MDALNFEERLELAICFSKVIEKWIPSAKRRDDLEGILFWVSEGYTIRIVQIRFRPAVDWVQVVKNRLGRAPQEQHVDNFVMIHFGGQKGSDFRTLSGSLRLSL